MLWALAHDAMPEAAHGLLLRYLKLLPWGASVILIVIFTPISYLIGLPLLEANDPRKSDVIVLLSSSQINSYWLTPDATQRTIGALSLYRQGFGKVIISSGSNLGSQANYAETQARWLEVAGIPKESIIVESRSARTYESVAEVDRIMRTHGWHSALAVTSELDVRRVRLLFEKIGIAVSVVGVPQNKPPRGLLYFPAGAAVLHNALYEYAGLVFYKWKGWI